MLFRFSVLAAVLAASVWAQSPAPELQPDQNDPSVVRARENLDQVRKLISAGALPLMRMNRAQEDLQDALDSTILRQNIYAKDLLPEQAEQMVLVAQRMALRRQRELLEMQQMVSDGVLAPTEAQATTEDLTRAKEDLARAIERADLVRELAENVRIEKEIASLESQAEFHPEWNGKVYTRYDGNGVFTAEDRRQLENAWAARFLRPLPISADGETAVHRSFGFDHRGRIDIAVTPDQPEGAWLMHYLQTKHIPYFAFRSAVPHMATGAHIHVGPGSTHLSAATPASGRTSTEALLKH